MEVLDPLTLIVTQNLPRLAALVRVQTHTVRSILKRNSAVACGSVVRPVESAFPIFSIPGFWEIVRTFQSEQGDRELSSDVDPEDCNRFVQRDRGWNYTIVPWED